MSELLDIKKVPDFGFLTFKRAKKEEQEQFVAGCKDVMNCAFDTVKNFCLLGLKLKALQGSRGFCCVLNENGEYYKWDEFGLFCERAFGFSKTRTSNFLALAKFVELKDGEVVFKKKEYENYNMSQLVELSSVGSSNYDLFPSYMTVKDMRLVKRLLSTAYNSRWTAEDALAEAKKRFESPPKATVVQPTIEMKEEVQEAVNSDVGIENKEFWDEQNELYAREEAETEVESVEEGATEKVPATGFRGEYLASFTKRIERCGIKATVYHRGLSANFTAEELAQEMERRFIYSLLDNRTSLKHLIESFVAEHLGGYDYMITLNGRRQSATVFSGALADTLCRALEKAFKTKGAK